MFRAVYSYFFGETVTCLSREEARAILNSAKTGDIEEKQESLSQDVEEEYTTLHRNGVITAKNSSEMYIIDYLYSYESSELNGKVGDKVSYICYVSDRKLHVTDVSIIDSEWDTVPNNVRSTWCTRTLTVKVTQRNLREVVAEPGELKINLNNVQSEFIPVVGDWIQVEAKCEIDENVSDLTGKVLEIIKVKPLRLKQTVGLVKRWDANSETGLVDRDIFFSVDALSCGYMPYVGDKVVVEAVESEQNFCSWRALKVIPQLVDRKHEIFKVNGQTFEDNVEGIEISDDIFLDFNKARETRSFEFVIYNKTNDDICLKEVSFSVKNGQCRLENAPSSCVIQPNCSLTISCKCTSRNYGCNKELLLFTFENYTIGRYVTITLKTHAQISAGHIKYNRDNLTFKQQHYRTSDTRKNYVPGQKVTATPRFIAKRIGQHEIPDKLWDLYLNFSSQQAMLCEALLKRKPCLHRLDSHCYEDYFHTLLHLEEIESVIAMRKYDQERACFITNGEYLMLEIENLSEKRPSIVQGDKVIASDPYKCNSSEFEGIVHKVGAKHVYLKFSPMFHDGYKGEDYSVRVVSSRGQMRRSHHAIGLAVRNLGRELLFPSKVNVKSPQFTFIADDDAKPNKQRSKIILNKPKEIVNENGIQSKLILKSPKEANTERKLPSRSNVKLEWFDKTLNCYQKQAVRNILLAEARPLPYFIFGPPGTGKTVTLVETILQILTLLPDARILVGTPSNSAADVVATRLIDSGILKPGDLIRFVAYKCVVDDSIPINLIPYCATADISAEGSDHARTHKTLKNGLTLGVSCSVIGRHRVTVSTCSNLGILFNFNFPKGHFTHIIIDEAGHLLEPEVMIPLSFLDVSSGQAVLAGVH